MKSDGKIFIPPPDKYPELILSEINGVNMSDEIRKQIDESVRKSIEKWIIEETNGHNGLRQTI